MEPSCETQTVNSKPEEETRFVLDDEIWLLIFQKRILLSLWRSRVIKAWSVGSELGFIREKWCRHCRMPPTPKLTSTSAKFFQKEGDLLRLCQILQKTSTNRYDMRGRCSAHCRAQCHPPPHSYRVFLLLTPYSQRPDGLGWMKWSGTNPHTGHSICMQRKHLLLDCSSLSLPSSPFLFSFQLGKTLWSWGGVRHELPLAQTIVNLWEMIFFLWFWLFYLKRFDFFYLLEDKYI